MAITSMQKIFDVEDEEYAFAAENFPPVGGGQTIPLVCPKVMGCLSGTGPDANPADSIFDNDPACKPSFAKKVNRAKSLAVTVEKNQTWLAKLSGGIVPKGTRFTIHFLNKNIAKPYTTTR